MLKNIFVILCISLVSGIQLSGQGLITLDDVWTNGNLKVDSVPGFNFLNDGMSFVKLVDNEIIAYDIRSGNQTEVLFSSKMVSNGNFDLKIDDFEFSPDESKILLVTNKEMVYRRSFIADYYLFDSETSSITQVYSRGQISEASFSPQGNKIAFIFKNNLYYKDLFKNVTVQVTKDGKLNEIINGLTDWVYEEELKFTKAFFWSPDGDKIAFLRFDESRVPEYVLFKDKGESYREELRFKYPKVGQENSIVDVYVYALGSRKPKKMKLGATTDSYIPRIKWTKDNDRLCIIWLNRHQNHLKMYLGNVNNGKCKSILEEKNPAYISIHDNLRFLNDQKHFIWTSEQNGYNHIYLYNIKGQLVRQLTEGPYDVTEFYGVDEENRRIYYQAAEISPLSRQVYSMDLDGKDKQLMSYDFGVNSAEFSSTFDYYTLTSSTINRPLVFEVYDRNHNSVRVLEDNKKLVERAQAFDLSEAEFFDFTTSDGVVLNGYMIKPPHFSSRKKYPVFMYVYGGPGSQKVLDSWGGENYWWFQMLAQQGIVVACVDNRGTAARGELFKKQTYLNLGKYETHDQIEAAEYLGSLPFTDKNRIGIFGWSYGGYVSTLCILKGNNVFKTAIAVAPVTHWKWYDSIYTERFMRTTQENPEGYENYAPVNLADSLKGDYLIVHGLADDNVHFQHSSEMVNALVEAGKQFDSYYYPNKKHSIRPNKYRHHLYTKMTEFIKNTL